jgi:RNA polymerase sigma-70 factor (ECF subfamily)
MSITRKRADEDLASAAQQGDREAFRALVERYERIAQVSAWHVVRDYHLAEDVVQSSFVIAHAKLPELRDPAAFGSWLLTIVRRQAQEESQARRMTTTTYADQRAAPPSERGDEHELLLSTIADLLEHERTVVVLRYIDGHSVQEIADMTGRPLGTVTKQLSRAVHRLRNRLRPQPGDSPCAGDLPCMTPSKKN